MPRDIPSVFAQPYKPDPRIDYSGKLWEGLNIVQARSKLIKQSIFLLFFVLACKFWILSEYIQKYSHTSMYATVLKNILLKP